MQPDFVLQNLDGLIWLLVLLIPFNLIQRQVHKEIQTIFYLITRKRKIALSLFPSLNLGAQTKKSPTSREVGLAVMTYWICAPPRQWGYAKYTSLSRVSQQTSQSASAK